MYKVWQKSNETDFLFISNINVIPFKRVPLGSNMWYSALKQGKYWAVLPVSLLFCHTSYMPHVSECFVCRRYRG